MALEQKRREGVRPVAPGPSGLLGIGLDARREGDLALGGDRHDPEQPGLLAPALKGMDVDEDPDQDRDAG